MPPVPVERGLGQVLNDDGTFNIMDKVFVFLLKLKIIILLLVNMYFRKMSALSCRQNLVSPGIGPW